MSKCKQCNKDMTTTKGCNNSQFGYIIRNGIVFRRDTGVVTEKPASYQCDCGRKNQAGNLHHYGCPVERCPNCGGQLLFCDCVRHYGDTDFVGSHATCVDAMKKKQAGNKPDLVAHINKKVVAYIGKA